MPAPIRKMPAHWMGVMDSPSTRRAMTRATGSSDAASTTGAYMGHAPGQKERRQGYAENTKEKAIGEEKGPGGKIKEKDRRKEKKSQQSITGGHESSLQGRGYAFPQKGTGAHHGSVGKGGKKAPSHAGGKGKVGAFIQKTS